MSFALAILTRDAAVPSLPALPDDADFRAMVARRRREMEQVTKRLGNDQITASQWYEITQSILLEGHTEAAYYGRVLALQEVVDGDLVDVLRGQSATDFENEFLRGFLDALESGDPRYFDEDGNWREAQILGRQASYLGKMRGTANEAMIEESPVDAKIYWRLGGAEEHCTECPDYAAMSPFTKDELPEWPGSNGTPCLYNCTCYLEVDGIRGFKPV